MFPWLAAASGLAGLFSDPGYEYQSPPGSPWARKFTKRAARKLWDYSQGIPGSAPDELAALSGLHAMQGEQNAASREGLLAALGPNAETMPGTADALKNLQLGQSAQSAGIDMGALLQFL